MADVKAKIQQSSDGTTATVDTQTNTVNTTTRSAFVIAKKLEEFTDVNTANLDDGSVLVYDLNRDEWASTTELNQQSVDAGEF